MIVTVSWMRVITTAYLKFIYKDQMDSTVTGFIFEFKTGFQRNTKAVFQKLNEVESP